MELNRIEPFLYPKPSSFKFMDEMRNNNHYTRTCWVYRNDSGQNKHFVENLNDTPILLLYIFLGPKKIFLQEPIVHVKVGRKISHPHYPMGEEVPIGEKDPWMGSIRKEGHFARRAPEDPTSSGDLPWSRRKIERSRPVTWSPAMTKGSILCGTRPETSGLRASRTPPPGGDGHKHGCRGRDGAAQGRRPQCVLQCLLLCSATE